ncbi:MAG: hypothetical protein ACHQ16_08150 [Candidatus Lutacidiplasmatales archaeon]
MSPAVRRTPRAHESTLRPPVISHLERLGYRVWADPDGRDYLDIVAARAGEVGLVELKISDWKTVRAQGVARRSLADWVAVAVPTVTLAEKIASSLRGPVAPRLGVWYIAEGQVRELRAAKPMTPPPAGTTADQARIRFRALVEAAVEGQIPEGTAWGGQARRTGGGRSYRLDEFGSD